jgi:hypothetical protein
MLLAPSERAFVDQLAEAKVPIKCIKINPNKTQPITPALQAILSKSQDLKVSLLLHSTLPSLAATDLEGGLRPPFGYISPHRLSGRLRMIFVILRSSAEAQNLQQMTRIRSTPLFRVYRDL